MKKTTETRKLDRTRVLNANDLQGIIGGATEVMNNPLYQGSGASGDNPLYALATVANNPLYKGEAVDSTQIRPWLKAGRTCLAGTR